MVYFSFYLFLSWKRFRKAIKNWFANLQSEFPIGIKEEEMLSFCRFITKVGKCCFNLKQFFAPLIRLIKCIWLCPRRAKTGALAKITKNCWKIIPKICRLNFYTHPDNLPEEIAGKGSNIHYAEIEFQKYADARGWDYTDIIASIFDSDTIVHPQYFAHLAYLYCRHPRERSSYQPLTLYNNNLGNRRQCCVTWRLALVFGCCLVWPDWIT